MNFVTSQFCFCYPDSRDNSSSVTTKHSYIKIRNFCKLELMFYKSCSYGFISYLAIIIEIINLVKNDNVIS